MDARASVVGGVRVRDLATVSLQYDLLGLTGGLQLSVKLKHAHACPVAPCYPHFFSHTTLHLQGGGKTRTHMTQYKQYVPSFKVYPLSSVPLGLKSLETGFNDKQTPRYCKGHVEKQ